VLTTHQVEEIENLLTDVIFIQRGRVVLDSSVEKLSDRYVQLNVSADRADQARQLHPFYEREVFGRTAMFFEGRTPAELSQLTQGWAELRAPSVADLFVAKMQAGVA
jgi:ABC-2 type transport system ATP-binding protein